MQAKTRSGELRFRPAYPKKHKGDHVTIKPVKEKQTFSETVFAIVAYFYSQS